MVFKLVEGAQKNWRRIDGHNQLPKLIQGVRFTDGIEVIGNSAAPQAQAAGGARHRDPAATVRRALRDHRAWVAEHRARRLWPRLIGSKQPRNSDECEIAHYRFGRFELKIVVNEPESLEGRS
jgi:hypothetical protein